MSGSVKKKPVAAVPIMIAMFEPEEVVARDHLRHSVCRRQN